MRSRSICSHRDLTRFCGWGICLLFSLALSQPVQAQTRMVSVDHSQVVACPGGVDGGMPDFTGPECTQSLFYDANPQQRDIWLKTTIDLPVAWLDESTPLGLFVFAKSSSEAYLNNQFVGRNGTPSTIADDEFPGNIDAVFYLPSTLLKPTNDIVLHLSSHHGFLQLSRPIHFVGIGDYASPQSLFQNRTLFSMILLGALLLGTLYFLVLRQQSLFLLMAGLASAQLAAESIRGIYAYSYPLHDLRLVVIVLLSMGFGLCLLAFVARKFAEQIFARWMVIGGITTALITIFTPSFDTKTALAILAPATCATALLAFETYQSRTRELVSYLSVFIIFDGVVLLTLNTFHNITYYLLIAAMTTYLFASQARALTRERKLLMDEQQRVSKLTFRLDQLKQQDTPTTIVVSGAGEISHISTQKISYCKAAGDYVELHLLDGRAPLYSGTLKGLESSLPNTFLKVHRSYVVNLEFVSTLKSLSGAGILVLKGGEEIPVSRRVMPIVRDTLKEG